MHLGLGFRVYLGLGFRMHLGLGFRVYLGFVHWGIGDWILVAIPTPSLILIPMSCSFLSLLP